MAEAQASAEKNPKKTILWRSPITNPPCLHEKFVILQAGERPEIFKDRICVLFL